MTTTFCPVKSRALLDMRCSRVAHVLSSLGVETTLLTRSDVLLRQEDTAVARHFTRLAQSHWARSRPR